MKINTAKKIFFKWYTTEYIKKTEERKWRRIFNMSVDWWGDGYNMSKSGWPISLQIDKKSMTSEMLQK